MSPADGKPADGKAADGKLADGKLAVGRLGAPRGVRGELRVHSYSGEVEHLLALREAELVREGITMRLRILRSSVGSGGLTMVFEGYPTPETARVLTGMEILLPRQAVAPLKAGEWYIADLVGLSLVAPGGGEAYGKVLAVVEGGADPCLEVALPAGGRVLVPFRKEFIGEIELEAGRLELLAPWILE